jgi:hypothetical protein
MGEKTGTGRAGKSQMKSSPKIPALEQEFYLLAKRKMTRLPAWQGFVKMPAMVTFRSGMSGIEALAKKHHFNRNETLALFCILAVAIQNHIKKLKIPLSPRTFASCVKGYDKVLDGQIPAWREKTFFEWLIRRGMQGG